MLELRNTINNISVIINSQFQDDRIITKQQWDQIEKAVMLLNPLAVATDQLQGDKSNLKDLKDNVIAIEHHLKKLEGYPAFSTSAKISR